MLPKLVIADQNLKGFFGHYWEYDASVAKLFKERGHDVTILSNKTLLQPLSTDDAIVIPWFSQGSVDAYRPAFYHRLLSMFGTLPKPLLALMKYGYSFCKEFLMKRAVSTDSSPFGTECVAAIKHCNLSKDDMFFIQTIYPVELRSLIGAFKDQESMPLPRILLMLRRDPDEIFMTGFKEAIADMAPLAKNLCFFADTELLATAYEKQFDITCAVLPVMCDISLLAPHNASSYPIILTYLGSAGQEKGFHLLPLLLEKLAAYPHFDRLECHIQAYVPPNHYDPVIDAAITRLESYVPQVRLYRDELPQVDYLKLLMQSHIVLLPYDAKAYKSRSSGVLMQAMAAGKVTVIPDHTWLSYAAPVQASQRFSGDSFADAVIKALEQYELLASSAYDYSKSMDFQKLSAKFYQILTD